MGGGSSSWCSGIEFGGLELRSCGLTWDQLRLIELCRLHKAGAPSGPDECRLQNVPPVIIMYVLEYLDTPLPDPMDVPANVVVRRGA
mmetsp:Transcript_12860/g.27098  ORF Transcript_12860/g.27098 Transcript_12860/m.27098 type:complete len:87 (-) Transcript_12860:163-423(-)